MSRSRGDQRGKRPAGEITGHMGRAKVGADGYHARCHDDNVGSPDGKRWAKQMVTRARRRALKPDTRRVEID